MSKYTIYVFAGDEFYKNPIIRGQDFFICFDDDDIPELVIMKKGRDSDILDNRASEILENLNIKAKFKGRATLWSQRCFGDNFNFQDAYSIFIDITATFSAEIISKHEGLFDDKSIGGADFQYFDKDFNFEKWCKAKFDNVK